MKFNDLCVDGDVYKLGITMEKGYHGPVPAPFLPDSPGRLELSPWYLLPHQHRPVTHLQKHELHAEFKRGTREWTFRIHSDAREDVFVQLTFIFRSEGSISGCNVRDAGGGKYFLESGSVKYTVGDDVVEISPGAYEHKLPVLREDQHPAGCQYVHVNLMTPFDRTFTIRLL